MNPSGGPSSLGTLLPLLLAVVVVVRFAFSELKLRTVRTPAIWIRPAILVPLLLYLVFLSFAVDGRDDGVTVASLIGGSILGALTGILIVRNSVFSPAGARNAVRVQGSRVTLAIWIGALVVRFAARFLFAGGTSPAAQLPLNCGTVALVAVAFVVIAIAFQREIRRLAPV